MRWWTLYTEERLTSVVGAIGRRYKFFWKGCNKGTAGVGVFIVERSIDSVVDVGKVNERIMYVMQMIRWMCDLSMKDRRTNEELRRLVGVETITTVIRSGRLRWYGYVMRTG